MEGLLKLLSDGHARTVEMLAAELDTSVSDIARKLEYLEIIGVIRRVSLSNGGCSGNRSGCGGCSGHTGDGKRDSALCKGCIPDEGFKNMGVMWEVV
jgi:hypothetical protein